MAEGAPTKNCSNPEACFLFRSPPHYTAYLKDAGFDALSLANKHARDFGEEGRTASMATLDSYGLHHSGRRGDIASWEQDGLTVAFIAFSPTIKSYLLNDIPTAQQAVLELAATHVPRAPELYKDRLIAYSLGNFATHWGVSVNGIAGWALILTVEVDREGVFLNGRIDSALQTRPNGPVWDPDQRAYKLIRELTEEAFWPSIFLFQDDGTFLAAE